MPSNRGRKRNDNLPPNRARDVQRAFRARRNTHLQDLERQVDELENENKYYREALNLPPASRPLLGRGPTGKDQPDHDADKFRCQSVSFSGESAGSPSSCASSPELIHSLIAPSISSRTITMDVGPSHRTMVENEQHHTDLSHFRSEHGESTSILAPMPFKTPSPLSHYDRILPPLHSPSIAIYPKTPNSYPPTSERSNFDPREPCVREARNDSLSPQHPNSYQYLHLHPQSHHDPNLLHHEFPFLRNASTHFGTTDSLDPPEQAHRSHTLYLGLKLDGSQPYNDT